MMILLILGQLLYHYHNERRDVILWRLGTMRGVRLTYRDARPCVRTFKWDSARCSRLPSRLLVPLTCTLSTAPRQFVYRFTLRVFPLLKKSEKVKNVARFSGFGFRSKILYLCVERRR